MRARTVALVSTLAVALGIFWGPNAVAVAAGCVDDMNATWEGTVITEIHFSGSTRCTILVTMSGQAKLYSALGSLEASGNPFSCVCNIGGSSGTYSLGIVGTVHELEYLTTVTLPPGYVWGAMPPECIGTGTPTSRCDYHWTFVITPGGGASARIGGSVIVSSGPPACVAEALGQGGSCTFQGGSTGSATIAFAMFAAPMNAQQPCLRVTGPGVSWQRDCLAIGDQVDTVPGIQEGEDYVLEITESWAGTATAVSP